MTVALSTFPAHQQASWGPVNWLDRSAKEHPVVSTGLAVACLGGTILSGALRAPLPVTLSIAAGTVLVSGLLVRNWSHLFAHVIYQSAQAPYNGNLDSHLEPRDCYDAESGKLLASLMVAEGQIPYLHYAPEVQDPEMRGRIRGFLLADKIHDLIFRLFQPTFRFLRFMAHRREGEFLEASDAHDQLEFPDSYYAEQEAVYEGVREWSERTGHRLHHNLEGHLKHMHVLTDVYKRAHPVASNACSVVALKGPHGVAVARNFDWFSAGISGKHQLLEEWSLEDGRRLHSITFPGYVGAFTAWTDDLRVFINELGTRVRGEGMPCTTLVKEVATHCHSVAEAEEYVREHPAAASMSLTVVDQHSAKVMHFYPYGDGRDEVVSRTLTEEEPLIVLNDAWGQDDSCPIAESSNENSTERCTRLRCLWEELCEDDNSTLVEKAVEMIRAVGKSHTIHTVVFDGSEVHQLVYDNFHAHQHLE